MGAMNGYNTGLRAREALERLKLGNAAYVNGQHFGDLSDARRLDTAESEHGLAVLPAILDIETGKVRFLREL